MDEIMKCRDLGIDCDFVACGHDENELFKKADEHVQAVHNLHEGSWLEKARVAAYEGYCDYGDTEDLISEECSECYEECFECSDECCA